jgi:quercetin dioxygenase-like cupin family protein
MRRSSVLLVLTILLGIALGSGNPQKEMFQTKVLLEKNVSEYAGKDMVVTVRELTLQPGAVGSKHRHPGLVFVYVLEGDVESGDRRSTRQGVPAWGDFFGGPHQLHLSTRNAGDGRPARILSFILSRKGEPLTQPEN